MRLAAWHFHQLSSKIKSHDKLTIESFKSQMSGNSRFSCHKDPCGFILVRLYLVVSSSKYNLLVKTRPFLWAILMLYEFNLFGCKKYIQVC